MTSRFSPGDAVQTPLGKGVVREVRNNGRLSVDLQLRTIVIEARDVSPLAPARPAGKPRRTRAADVAGASVEGRDDGHGCQPVGRDRQVSTAIDLHGLAVEQALARVDQALNDALLADETELRLIHGRSGGRLRSAVHQRLRTLSAVRAFRIDPRNPGVTIVSF